MAAVVFSWRRCGCFRTFQIPLLPPMPNNLTNQHHHRDKALYCSATTAFNAIKHHYTFFIVFIVITRIFSKQERFKATRCYGKWSFFSWWQKYFDADPGTRS